MLNFKQLFLWESMESVLRDAVELDRGTAVNRSLIVAEALVSRDMPYHMSKVQRRLKNGHSVFSFIELCQAAKRFAIRYNWDRRRRRTEVRIVLMYLTDRRCRPV